MMVFIWPILSLKKNSGKYNSEAVLSAKSIQ